MKQSISQNLTTTYLGKDISYFPQIDSTQKEIWRRIENGKIENGTLIVADIQTEAIGTHGRKWYTSCPHNIAFSFLLCPNILVEKLENLTTQIAKIMIQVIKELYQIELTIKQPNDLMIKGKKVGGILTQTKLQGEMVKYLVIGIGVNTNQKQFEKEIQQLATSIQREYHQEIDNSKVIAKFCNVFEKEWEQRLKES